ncbi:TIR domain-containing protein [Haloferula sp. BvORR071]|uniref:TIR domain-containing protein n=1 Tax=Haloferula sp. BvORR071 TaxID=1396141 RepID=UPI000696B201|nr:TIR domain-containing protein [Haloferula sp. BvORR071]
MKVFLSWSGERSKQIAEFLDVWLPSVVQAVQPWISTRHIDGGAAWFGDISEQLTEVTVGIVCLTKENLDKPWILFESGALARGLTSQRVIILACDLEVSAIRPPLSLFNIVAPDREGVWKMVSTINSRLGERSLKPAALDRAFEAYWSEFTAEFKRIVESTPETTEHPKVDEKTMLVEVLGHVRGMDKRLRSLESSSAKRKPLTGAVPAGVDHYLSKGLAERAAEIFERNKRLDRATTTADALYRAGRSKDEVCDSLREHFSDDEVEFALHQALAFDRDET